MKIFFANIKRSLSDASFYQQIVSENRKANIGYLAKLALLIGLIGTAVIVVMMYVLFLPKAKDFIVKEVPADIKVEITNGELSANVPTPYYIPVEEKEKTERLEYFLVYDPTAPALVNAPETYKTMIFVNKDVAVSREESGEINAVQFKDLPNMTITQEIVLDWYKKLYPWVWLIGIFVFAGVFAVFFVSSLITSLAGGFVVWLIMKISRKGMLYQSAFAVSVQAITFVVLLDIVFMLFGLHGGVDFFPSVLLTALFALLFLSKKAPTPVIAE